MESYQWKVRITWFFVLIKIIENKLFVYSSQFFSLRCISKYCSDIYRSLSLYKIIYFFPSSGTLSNGQRK